LRFLAVNRFFALAVLWDFEVVVLVNFPVFLLSVLVVRDDPDSDIHFLKIEPIPMEPPEALVRLNDKFCRV
jgi:hypothetical protein